jgi:hypothetical protein
VDLWRLKSGLVEIKERHDGEYFAVKCLLIHTKPINQIQELI